MQTITKMQHQMGCLFFHTKCIACKSIGDIDTRDSSIQCCSTAKSNWSWCCRELGLWCCRWWRCHYLWRWHCWRCRKYWWWQNCGSCWYMDTRRGWWWWWSSWWCWCTKFPRCFGGILRGWRGGCWSCCFRIGTRIILSLATFAVKHITLIAWDETTQL